MSLSEATLLLFTFCNAARIIAYLPQIHAAARDQTGSRAVSRATWTLFLFAHLSGVAYAIINLGEVKLALIFAGNAACCVAILVATALSRRRHREKSGAPVGDRRAVMG